MNLSSIYCESYIRKNLNEDILYYLVSVRPVLKNEYYVSLYTRWVGSENNYEVRKADSIIPTKILDDFKILGYPLGLINNEEELTSLLNIGGHALVNKELLKKNCEEFTKPKIVIGSQYEGYLDYITLESKYKKRFARDIYRMEILERDNFQCRICGSSPDDNVHVRLEIHHIKPWEEGGISISENLITLCAVCHSGIKLIDREVLYKKVGVCFPTNSHLLYNLNNSWNNEQYLRFIRLTSNSVTMRMKTVSNSD